MAVAILKEVESPYDVHDYIRSCLGDTLEAKEFAKQFLERRAKQKASQQRQQQQVGFTSRQINDSEIVSICWLGSVISRIGFLPNIQLLMGM